jgi:site-specific DNA-methyltransferase (adenine-specific)
MKIDEIKLNLNNPRIISDEKLNKLIESIQDFPKMMELRPIVVDSNKIVLGGNMRLLALKKIGYDEVPDSWIKIADQLTEEEKKRFIIEDNVEFGTWNWDLLTTQFEIESLTLYGLDIPELYIEKIEEISREINDDEIPDNVKSICKVGDIWQLGEHRLMCGDSTKIDDIKKVMNNKKADMLLTDPPYGVNYEGKTKKKLKIQNDYRNEEKLILLIKNVYDNVDHILRDGCYCIATVPAGPLHILFADDWNKRKWLRQIMVWVKDSMVLGHSEYHYKHEPILFGWKTGGKRLKNTDRSKTTVWEFARPKASIEHPTMKPVEMWIYAIKNHTSKNNIIIDPFLGSGTTIIAAEKTKRICYGVEIDPHYCDVIIGRWEKYTGNKAKKVI